LNRRDFVQSSAALMLAGCGSGADEMPQEFTLQQSPSRTAHEAASTVPGYAFGNWTPNVGGTATYTVQIGRYTRIGERVFFNCEMIINTIGTGQTGQVLGLPFTSKANGSTHAACVGVFSGLTINVVFLTGAIAEGTAAILLLSLTAAATQTTNNGIFGNGSRITVSGHYDI
jgi:hypothetical protein